MTAPVEHETLRVEREGDILILTLNRPDKLNALFRPMQYALEYQFRAADADPGIRAIVITGEGRAFCSGADVGGLKEAAETTSDPAQVTVPKFTNRQAGIFTPTIVAINGVCAGAGLHFVSDGDIIIASETAAFVDTHVNVGQVTALEPIGLMRKTDLGTVLRMVLLGKSERLVSEVVPADRLRERAMEIARIVATASPAAVRGSLKAIWESMELPLAKAYENGFDILIRHRAHPDAKEGPAAFLAKRAPVWQG
jgi:enoyl-CoA hydratase/carnithine racemase